MNYLHAIILAIVEGVTEFLPVSSTGHMVLTAHLLQVPQTEFTKSFEIIIQLGAILAVVALYGKTLLVNREVWKRVMIAFLPTATIGYVLYKLVKHVLLGNQWVTLAALFIGGIVMIILEKMYKEKEHHSDTIERLSYKQAFCIGLCQSISIIPGVSRAAATILGGIFLGAKRKTAVEFSFLLAVPTMLAATILDLKETRFAFTSYELSLLGVGLFVSFIVAFVVIKGLLQFVKNHTFVSFGMYRIILSIIYGIFIL